MAPLALDRSALRLGVRDDDRGLVAAGSSRASTASSDDVGRQVPPRSVGASFGQFHPRARRPGPAGSALAPGPVRHAGAGRSTAATRGRAATSRPPRTSSTFLFPTVQRRLSRWTSPAACSTLNDGGSDLGPRWNTGSTAPSRARRPYAPSASVVMVIGPYGHPPVDRQRRLRSRRSRATRGVAHPILDGVDRGGQRDRRRRPAGRHPVHRRRQDVEGGPQAGASTSRRARRRSTRPGSPATSTSLDANNGFPGWTPRRCCRWRTQERRQGAGLELSGRRHQRGARDVVPRAQMSGYLVNQAASATCASRPSSCCARTTAARPGTRSSWSPTRSPTSAWPPAAARDYPARRPAVAAELDHGRRQRARRATCPSRRPRPSTPSRSTSR